MFFASDNWSGAADEISEALRQNSGGMSPAYGTSESDRAIELRFNDLFEREVAVFFVGTGTAANSLALSAVNRPGGFVFCHREAHLIEDECGAPEFFTGGARLSPVDGQFGKMDSVELEAQLQRLDPSFIHHGQPMAVSMTQSTETGTVYDLDEVQRIGELCERFELPLHMDGARFANALVRLDVSPAEMTWRRGVDVLSFGGTKNGCWCAEAIVFFKPEMARQMPFIRKRAAQLFSKTRFIATQLHTYFQDDLWLRLARHANAMADQLADRIDGIDGIKLAWPVGANAVFVWMPPSMAKRIQEAGGQFYRWPTPGGGVKVPDGMALYRLVASFATTPKHVDDFVVAARAASAAMATA